MTIQDDLKVSGNLRVIETPDTDKPTVTVSVDEPASPSTRPDVVVVERRPQATGDKWNLSGKIRENIKWFSRVDLVLLTAALVLSVFGTLLVWSATRARLEAAGDDPNTFLTRHALNIVIGVALAIFITRLDYRTLRSYTPIVYGVVIVSLFVVLTPLGVSQNGTKGWLPLPAGFTMQPAEFAKVVVILALAMVLSEREVGRDEPSTHDMRYALAWAAGPVALVMLQPDLGSALVIGSIVIGILLAANASTKWLLGIVGSVVAAGFLAVVLGILDRYQLDRLLTFMDPTHDLQGIGYNTHQARIAIGGGGLWGQGLFQGNQTQGAFVPYQQTDFVFSVAGEEFGLIGATVIIGLLGLILWRGIQIARQARDPFGRLVATGVVCWLAFQAFENIGMNLGIMPVTGVPLPFVSYGGSSMFAAWIAIGLLQSVHIRSRQ